MDLSGKTMEEKVQIAVEVAESALLAAAQKVAEHPVTQADWSKFRIELAFLLNERLNTSDQRPIDFSDIMDRVDVLERREQEMRDVMGRIRNGQREPLPS